MVGCSPRFQRETVLAATDKADNLNGVTAGKARTGKGGGGDDGAVALHDDGGGIVAASAQHGFDGQAVLQRDLFPIDDDVHGLTSVCGAGCAGKTEKRVPPDGGDTLHKKGMRLLPMRLSRALCAGCQLPYVSTICLRFRGQDAYALSQPVLWLPQPVRQV